MISSDFLSEMSAYSYYRYMRVAKMMLSHEGTLVLVESLNNDDTGSKRWGISQFDDTGLYTGTTKVLRVLIRVASNFERTPNEPAPFLCLHYTPAKARFWESRGMCFESPFRLCFGTCFVSEHTYVPYAHDQHSTVADVFSSMWLHSYGPNVRKRAWTVWSEGLQCQFIEHV